MPYIVATVWYPSHKAIEVSQKYLEVLQAIPFDENLTNNIVPAAASDTKEGAKVMSVSEVKPGKLEEALEMSRKRMVMFNEIEGLEYSIEVQSTAAEGLVRVGVVT